MRHMGFTHFSPLFGLFYHSRNKGIILLKPPARRQRLEFLFVSLKSDVQEACQSFMLIMTPASR